MKKSFQTQQKYFWKIKKIILFNVNWTCWLRHFKNNTLNTQNPQPIIMLVSVHNKGLLRITTWQLNLKLGESDNKCQNLINWHAWYDLVWAPCPVTNCISPCFWENFVNNLTTWNVQIRFTMPLSCFLFYKQNIFILKSYLKSFMFLTMLCITPEKVQFWLVWEIKFE